MGSNFSCQSTGTSFNSVFATCKSDKCESSCLKNTADDTIKKYEEQMKESLKGILHDQILAFEKKLDELIKLKIPTNVIEDQSNNLP